MKEEFPLIPAEEISRKIKRKLIEKGRKGFIDISTYNQLKGLLDTSKIVIEQVPLIGAKKIDIETVNHLESLTDNAISILEDTNITEIIPKEKKFLEMVRRGPTPRLIERTISKINRFNDIVNSFEKKAFSCNLDGISKDIIETEYLTADIDKYIHDTKMPKRNLAIYNKMSEKYKHSINYIEKICKCK